MEIYEMEIYEMEDKFSTLNLPRDGVPMLADLKLNKLKGVLTPNQYWEIASSGSALWSDK